MAKQIRDNGNGTVTITSKNGRGWSQVTVSKGDEGKVHVDGDRVSINGGAISSLHIESNSYRRR